MKHHYKNHLVNVALTGALALALSACSKQVEPISNTPQENSVGNAIEDTVITTRVKSALMANVKINSDDFKVETLKGEVMLSGFVNDQDQIDLATATVLTVEGVKSVKNNVELTTSIPTAGNKLDSGVITSKVKAALLADPSIDSLDIHVITRINEVQLSGFVKTQAQMDRAVQLATATAGVLHVSNEMKIKK